MAVKIELVEMNSLSAKVGIIAGDELISINGQEICDVLDYRFYMSERILNIIVNRQGEFLEYTIKKSQYDDIGLEFKTYLMDKHRSCKNKCVFCFIDQLPPGMRKSLYFKDDDSRLSFLFGNYITLTNLTDHDVERIIKMHISPVNISVHTTNPELRVKMMKNKNAGDSLRHLYSLAQAGIKINTQLVLCPELNNGMELEKSLLDLGKLYPSVQSIACVPVGTTKYREGLFPLRPFTKAEANETVDIIEKFGDKFLNTNGVRLVFPGDEFYLLAEREIPKSEFYDDFPQIENGVGMWESLRSEFMDCLETQEDEQKDVSLSIATGKAAYPLLCKLVDEAKKKWHNLDIKVYEIINNFFGENITVAGLLTATDLIEQLSGKPLGDRLLISSDMLRSEGDIFLDDVSLEELSRKLGIEVIPVNNDGWLLLETILNI